MFSSHLEALTRGPLAVPAKEKTIILLIGIVIGFFLGLLAARLGAHNGVVVPKEHDMRSSIVSRIQGLIEVTSLVRDKALSILRDMSTRHSVVANVSATASPGEPYCVPVSLYRFNRYRLFISSNASLDLYLRGEGGERLLVTLSKSYKRWLSVTRSGPYEVCTETHSPALLRILVEAWPPRNITNDPVFKALAIALWSAENLHYVSDPRGLDYVAPPEETLRTLSGDCDDFAVLLASMYLSIGLRAAVALVDTNNDGIADHAAALVELPLSKERLGEKIPAVLQFLGARYDGYTTVVAGNTTWLVIDPAMAYEGKEPWFITKPDYRIVYVITP